MVVSNLLLVSPEQAQSLLEQGYTYVDVRSEPEFALGRPAGAINVPLLTVEGDRLVENPEFVQVMLAVFRTTDPLVIGCRSGARSHVAVQQLAALGFGTVRELRHGFEGSRDAFGRRLPGWRHSGLPIETGESERASYAAVRGAHHRRRLG